MSRQRALQPAMDGELQHLPAEQLEQMRKIPDALAFPINLSPNGGPGFAQVGGVCFPSV